MMPKEINGTRYYGTADVCEKVGISQPTLFRWLRRGILSRLHKDRRGWRLFTEDDVSKIQAEATRIEVEYTSSRSRKTKSTSGKTRLSKKKP
jgi:predicted site-specific integrase-resolvase